MMQAFVLEKTVKKPARVKQKVTNLARKQKELRKLKNLKYSQFLPLYELWKEYFKSTIGDDPTKSDDRLLKVDYHGCLMHVSVADNPSQVGLHGIVVRETKNTFQLITDKDKLLTIPKQGTSFQFLLDGHAFTLFGDGLKTTAAGRSNKKFKSAQTVPYLIR